MKRQKIESIAPWLGDQLAGFSGTISLAAIFGSVARGEELARDCDLVVVAKEDHRSPSWKVLQSALFDIPFGFMREFRFPLSVVLLTPREWEELESFFAPNRPLDWSAPTS